jgi:hypothetical protein
LFKRFTQAFWAAMDVRAFYEAKTLEQQQRHLKYHDTAYNLEPNIKESRVDCATFRRSSGSRVPRALAVRGGSSPMPDSSP